MKSQNRLDSRSTWSAERIALRLQLIVIVLAATAIPIEWRPDGRDSITTGLKIRDALANVAGYLPIGIVLGELGVVRSIITAALMAMFAESCQLAMMYPDPSVMDVTSSVTGGSPARFIEPPDVQ